VRTRSLRGAPWLARIGAGHEEAFVALVSRHSNMQPLADLADAGKLTPAIDRRIGLTDVATALTDLEAGKITGQVVVAIA
jgi:NADPH:quinone reductase-like Zn-dependent oxidoreductase